MSVAVRFAPSPTGRLHIGNIRTAVLNYLFAVKSAVASCCASTTLIPSAPAKSSPKESIVIWPGWA